MVEGHHYLLGKIWLVLDQTDNWDPNKDWSFTDKFHKDFESQQNDKVGGTETSKPGEAWAQISLFLLLFKIILSFFNNLAEIISITYALLLIHEIETNS